MTRSHSCITTYTPDLGSPHILLGLAYKQMFCLYVYFLVCVSWCWFWASKPRASSEVSLLSFLLLCSHFQLLSTLSSPTPWRICLVSYLSSLHFLCTNEQICAYLRAFFFLLEEYTTGIFLNWALVTSQHFLEIPPNQTAELALPLLIVVQHSVFVDAHDLSTPLLRMDI